VGFKRIRNQQVSGSSPLASLKINNLACFGCEHLPKKLGQLLANLFFGVNLVPLKMFGCF